MPPDGYTTVTISDKTAAKLADLVVTHDLESVAEAVDFAADAARDPETPAEAELARLLHQKLAD
jgi:hypothetical protein